MAFSSDSKLLFVVRDGYDDKSPPQLSIVVVETGDVQTAWELECDVPIQNACALVLGPASRFAVLGSITDRYDIDTIWVFDARDILRFEPQCIHAVSLKEKNTTGIEGNPYSGLPRVRFNLNEDKLLVGDSRRYFVFDLSKKLVTDRHESNGDINALAISPDGRRVLMMDSTGILLRERTLSLSLPQLKSLPWGTWRIDSQNLSRFYASTPKGGGRFAINADWTLCAGFGFSDQVSNEQVVHTWSIDRPIELGDDGADL